MFSNPQKNLEQFDIVPGQKVADFGAGAGYYTFPLARLVGPTGIVVALDIQKDLLLTIKREAHKFHLFNVETIIADLSAPLGSKLKDNSIDRAIVANFLFQAPSRNECVAEITRVLKPGGKVLVVDWLDSFGGMGPNMKDVIPKETCRALFTAQGFVLEREIQAGSHHYGFVFKKP